MIGFSFEVVFPTNAQCGRVDQDPIDVFNNGAGVCNGYAFLLATDFGAAVNWKLDDSIFVISSGLQRSEPVTLDFFIDNNLSVNRVIVCFIRLVDAKSCITNAKIIPFSDCATRGNVTKLSLLSRRGETLVLEVIAEGLPN